MKITLCSSVAFVEQSLEIKAKLETLGHEVKMHPTQIERSPGEMISVLEYYRLRKQTDTTEGWIWDQKETLMKEHFAKIAWADAILVLNYVKDGVPGYIGGNTFLEMGVAFYLGKKIFLLNPIPEVSYKEEILGMHPTVICQDLTKIN